MTQHALAAGQGVQLDLHPGAEASRHRTKQMQIEKKYPKVESLTEPAVNLVEGKNVHIDSLTVSMMIHDSRKHLGRKDLLQPGHLGHLM